MKKISILRKFFFRGARSELQQEHLSKVKKNGRGVGALRNAERTVTYPDGSSAHTVVKVQFRTEFELNKSLVAFDRGNRLVKIVLVNEIGHEELQRLFSICFQVICIYQYDRVLVDLRFAESIDASAELLLDHKIMQEKNTLVERLSKVAIYTAEDRKTSFGAQLNASISLLSPDVSSQEFTDVAKAISWLLNGSQICIL